MERDRAQRITEIFKSVLAAPRDERATRLERACAGDPELRREVRELLRASEKAWDSDAQEPAKVPHFIGKYEILEPIGRGGFGEVFLGRDPVIKRDVAVKLCSSADEDLRQRFFREAEIVGRLKHSNITTVHDSGSFGEVPYMVQEYLPGEDLAHVIRGRRRISAATRLDYLLQVARGLEYAHGMGVIHRDVKPSNIRVLADGTVKILDFGIARLLGADTRLTKTGSRIGTECYMAPEQLRGEEAGVRADVFSFGVVAYELMTYVHPFQADQGPATIYKVLEEEPVPLPVIWPPCPPQLDDCIAQCLEKDAKDRPASMTVVLEELERIDLSGVPPSSTATQATLVRAPRTPRRRRRRQRSAWPRRLAMAGIPVAALAAILVARELWSPAPTETSPEASATPAAAEPVEAPESLEPESASEKEASEPKAEENAVVSPPPEEVERGIPESPAEDAKSPMTTTEASPAPPPASPADESRNESGAATLPIAAEPEPVQDLAATEAHPEPEPARDLTAADAHLEAAAAPPIAAETPEPAPPAAPGTLVINALPWASIVRVAAAGSSDSVDLPSRYTPLAVPLPPGDYEVKLSGTGDLEHGCEVEVRSGTSANCLVKFGRVKAREFFSRDQAPGPGAGPPLLRPADPVPVRGNPRGPPPRTDPPLQGPGPTARREKVPGWIRDAAQAYFDGDYAIALDGLADGTAKKKLQRFYVGLFRGATRYSIYLLSGEQDASLAAAAVEDLKECRRQRPDFVPHPDFFSPRFIELFSVAAAP